MKSDLPRHLRGVPLHGGLPVPAIVATLKGHIEIRPSSWPGSSHMTVWVPESSEPDFGKYDEEKHRRCMAGRWCHVCTRTHIQVPLLLCMPRHRTPTDNQVIVMGGRPFPLVRQPWVCAECLAYAAHHCPPLRQAVEAGRGLVATPIRYKLITCFYKPVTDTDPVPPPGATTLLSVKIALERAVFMPLPEWVKRFASRRSS